MDTQILQVLLKFPKKKQIKKLFQHCISIANQQKSISQNFTTPLIESLHEEIGLGSLEAHRLLLAVSNLFKIAAYLNFEQERLNNVLASRMDEQLKQLTVGILLSFSDQVRQIENQRVKQGKTLDIQTMDWNIATEIGNQKGKVNTPVVEITLPLTQFNKSTVQNVKFQMKGQQFEVFFNNLTKIKQTLNDLITQG